MEFVPVEFYHVILADFAKEQTKSGGLTVDDFEVIIPVNQITVCHHFDLETYSKFESLKKQNGGTPTNQLPVSMNSPEIPNKRTTRIRAWYKKYISRK